MTVHPLLLYKHLFYPNRREIRSFWVLQTLLGNLWEPHLLWRTLLSLNSASGPFGNLNFGHHLLRSFFNLWPAAPSSLHGPRENVHQEL